MAVRTTPAASSAQRRRARSRRLRRRSAPVSQTKRSERLYIRLTTGEAAYLAQLADRRGLKISEYARKAIFRAVAYCDTDSLFIVSAEHEGLVPCTNGPYKLPDGRRAVRALSWAQVDDILRDLAALNVYDLDGFSFKIEAENLDRGDRREIWFYGSREKSYGLFVIGDDGLPVPVKTSAHTIGQYRSPYPIDARVERCCEEPRPACPLFADLALWHEQDWRCLRCGTPWDFERRPQLKTYGSLIRSTLQGAERKRLAADGDVPTRQMRGLLIPRPVRVEHVTPIGKEVIVDPTDTDEGLTAEMLGATEVLAYEDTAESVATLRVAIKRAGVNRTACASRMRSQIQAILNSGATPHKDTVAKLQAALKYGRK